MTDQEFDPAHDTRIEIGGDVYWVRRPFDLIRRIEQAFGALGELDQRLRRRGMTATELVQAYAIALKDQASRPPDDEIGEYIADAGINAATDQIAVLVMHLFAGNRVARQWLEAEAAKVRDGENPPPAV